MKKCDKRRALGEHLTPVEIFKKFILPEIKDELYDYRWVDLFAGEGNLILPMLELIPREKRTEFFRKHIFLFDIQPELVKKAIENAAFYGIPKELAEQNIKQSDTLAIYPKLPQDSSFPIYHITNPPYLYLGYIVKHEETKSHLKYFAGANAGYQDLYQLALISDLRHNSGRMIYIIPSNFLFGASVSNKIREDLLMPYGIKKAVIFEKEIFEHTGTNVGIFFFERKAKPKAETISFEGLKINSITQRRLYSLNPKNHYRAGTEFEETISQNKVRKPISISYYLTMEEVEKNKGDFQLEVIDANNVQNGNGYKKMAVSVNKILYDKVKSNPLFVRTVDTGSRAGRAGIFLTREIYGVDGVLVTKAKYRTHPIQLFVSPVLSMDESILLKNSFNSLLEHLREKTDSEFMTTYKYSKCDYTRKYLGLSQVKKLIQTIPILEMEAKEGKGEAARELPQTMNSRSSGTGGLGKWL